MGTKGRPLRTTRKVANLRERPGWYRIENLRQAGQPEITQVSIYDEIGMLGVSADQFLQDLAGVSGDIEVHLNSPGGDVFDGIAIFNQLRSRAGAVAVVVDGLAASAASFIAQAASPGLLAMAPHSQMMIHDGFGMGIGDAADFRQLADLLDKASDNIARIYADRTGKPAAYWRERMQAETWYDDHEAVAEGLADSVVGQERPRDAWDLSVYLNPPAVRDADGNHAPMTGSHAHSHPDGRGSAHSHEHEHDGDASHYGHGHEDDGGDGMQMHVRNADKYNADDRKRMASNGHAMPDGSYPIEDEEDLGNAIHAVGRGGSGHDAIRRHIIKRARALGLSERIPDNWNDDGSLKSSPSDLSTGDLWMEAAAALEGSGK